MFHFLQKKMLKKIRNKGTINVLQGGGGGSAEYGQRPYFYKKKIWTLPLEDQAVKTPIHIFSECPAMAGFRMVLFNDTYPSQHTGQQSLCQITELALHGSVQELIERTDQYSYVHPTE